MGNSLVIKSFTDIKNLAVFKDFTWSTSVVDANGRPIYFKPLNIIYGRNYSGKTTLSRIVRSLETGHISDKYIDPHFKVTLSDGTTVDQTAPTNHSLSVRVFNEDYVKDNLKVFIDEDGDIAPFAVIGEDNAALADSLAKKEKELGSDDTPGSLLAREAECQRDRYIAFSNRISAVDDLDALLRNKGREIKNNTRYKDATYDIRHIKADIAIVQKDTYDPQTDEQIALYEANLNETTKAEITAWAPLNLQFDTILSQAQDLLGKIIQPSKPIQELLNDALLQEWVRNGRPLHEGKRSTCGFCGKTLPPELKEQLDRHFNAESESLRMDLLSLIETIDSKLEEIPTLLEVQQNSFYNAFRSESLLLKEKIDDATKRYSATLASIKNAIEKRSMDIFSAVTFPDTDDATGTLQSLWDEYEVLRKKSNDYTDLLSTKQSLARYALRLTEVSAYLGTIDHEKKLEKIGQLKDELAKKEELLKEASSKTEEAKLDIATLKGSMRDERNGAERVNQYLSHYFGHPSLSLVAIPEEDGGDIQYRFEIQRDGHRAYHLSEGERGLLAFCYFMGRLEDVKTTGTQPIIWIDDPISSLDENHVFFIYSLIRSHIIEQQGYGQLFVSTHSLNFLKYLRRVGGQTGVQKDYFIIERTGDTSAVRRMPDHLKFFATEFHYLFHRIYQCAHADENNDENIDAFYSFGNNVRKFLEMYLYFRYPNSEEKGDPSKLHRFLGDDAVSASLIDRIENEYSHLTGLFERGLLPVDVATMKSMAKLILDRIKDYDEEQYNALLGSVGESPDETTAVE